MRKYTAVFFIAALTLFGSLAVAQQQDSSLADVVKQHKTPKKAARVITNEDIPSRTDGDPAPAASAIGTAAISSAATESKTDDSKDAKGGMSDKTKDDKAEKKDSPEVAALKTRLDQLNKDVDNMKFSIKGMETQLSNENDGERRSILENAINSRTSSLQHTILEREEVTGKLQDLQKPKSDQSE